MNTYEELVENLVSGKLNLTHLELAYREYYRRRKDIPEGVKNLLVSKGHTGLLQFASYVRSICGNVELAYRRGKQHGEEGDK
ncbi:hypothetical protein LCGC14_1471540 [marine sediment metagenome]|uniref:Uncharacterized protein n=1 Tax=marine sediment metagenome TaxID=412755 RepID=A0A0F9ME04_9ZZZZ